MCLRRSTFAWRRIPSSHRATTSTYTHDPSWLFALESDSTHKFESFETTFLVQILNYRIRKNKNPYKIREDSHWKDKTSRPFSSRPLVLRGLKVAARITFLEANVAGGLVDGSSSTERQARPLGVTWGTVCVAVCIGIGASFRFSLGQSFTEGPDGSAVFPPCPYFSKGHNRSVAHVQTSAKLQQDGGRRLTLAAPTNGAANAGAADHKRTTSHS